MSAPDLPDLPDLPDRPAPPGYGTAAAHPAAHPAAMLGLLTLLALCAAACVVWGMPELGMLRTGHDAFIAALMRDPVWVTLCFFGLFVVISALPVPGASVLCLAAGAGFGLIWGTLLACLACTLGATLTMLVARHALRERVGRMAGDRMHAIDQGLARDGALYLFSLRVLPVLPYFVLNPLVGLTRMPTWTYMWVSFAGMLAGTAAYVNAGTQLGQVRTADQLLSLPVLASLVALAALPWIGRAVMWVARRCAGAGRP